MSLIFPCMHYINQNSIILCCFVSGIENVHGLTFFIGGIDFGVKVHRRVSFPVMNFAI